MKALLQTAGSGEVSVLDVPEPELLPGGILIRTGFSAISAGTERAARVEASKSLLSRAKARPDLVKQVLEFARKEGVAATYQKVRTRLDSLSPLGYSCAGTVIGVAEGVRDFQVGDRVACAGGGYANHSEINFVPCNLAAKAPDGVGLDAASVTTIGAIAMQGLRQAQPTLGETIVVIGAGLVGVLTIQLVKAAGCRAIAVDLDRSRAESALEFGADLALCPTDGNVNSAVKEFTQYGADAVIITAATPSSEPIETAAEIARDRGRIVIVGDVGLGVSRRHVYHKELSVVLSRSYGPGRYDPLYEQEGIDYPIGYVRWTEKRNMEAFLALLRSGAIHVERLIQKRYPVSEGGAAYAVLNSPGTYTVLIEYPASATSAYASNPSAARAAEPIKSTAAIKIGCIGAGGFAKNVIFPAVRNTKQAEFQSVATSSGIAAETARRSFGFRKAQTPKELIEAPEVQAVFVLSRHDTHARYVTASLAKHKPVFVEKPLAITHEQLDEIRDAVDREKHHGFAPFVMVGFNRRFAPMTCEIKRFFANRKEPMMVNVRVNAGYLPPDHWTQQKASGGRILGEFCHFVDWTRTVVGAPIEEVSACALPDSTRYNQDNISVRFSFQDGSIANLLYLANGDKSIGKEFMEVFCQGSIARLDDFTALDLAREGKLHRIKAAQDKGHSEEMRLTVEAMRSGNEAPIPLSEIVEITRATFAVVDSISTGQPVQLANPNRLKAAVGAC
jgi:predicted dehydrogenase/threonine dehydrogenase-like Zn-dependent dehydrogenase